MIGNYIDRLDIGNEMKSFLKQILAEHGQLKMHGYEDEHRVRSFVEKGASESMHQLLKELSHNFTAKVFTHNDSDLFSFESPLSILPFDTTILQRVGRLLRRQLTDLGNESLIGHQGKGEEYSFPALLPIYEDEVSHIAEGLALEHYINEVMQQNGYIKKRADELKRGHEYGLTEHLQILSNSFYSGVLQHMPRQPSLYNIRVNSISPNATLEKSLYHTVCWSVAPGGYTPKVDTALDRGLYRFRVDIGVGNADEDPRRFPITYNGQVVSLQV